MAYKATGNPVGRPKTKEYRTVLARIPQELADLVERYRTQHGGIPVAALIRDGLEWRIGDGDPRGMGLYLDEPVGIREREDTSHTDRSEGSEEKLRGLVLDLFAEVRRYREEIRASGQHSSNTQAADGDLPVASMAAQNTVGQQTPLLHRNVYSSNTENAPGVTGETATKVKADKALVEARIRQLRDQGLSYGKIAAQLQTEGIPTISGRGTWGKGNVERIAKGES